MDKTLLGKATAYIDKLDANLLYPIPRQIKREELGIDAKSLPFTGFDIWNAYEMSWLNRKGKPNVAIGTFKIPCQSPKIIESKSFKLYLNSYNQSQFTGIEQVKQQLQTDLSEACGQTLTVALQHVDEFNNFSSDSLKGTLIDDLDIDVDCYQYTPKLLQDCCQGAQKEETLVSHLLKSNCLVTGQPDWGSVQIHYRGRQLNRMALLKYLISFRKHQEFHEQCVERIFIDLMHYGQFDFLSVYARYTRRGGLDINPFRSSKINTLESDPINVTMIRQ